MKMGGLYCVQQQQQKKTQAEIQAEAQAKNHVSKAEKTGGSPCAKKRKEGN